MHITRNLLQTAMGDSIPDLVLHQASLVNVLAGEIHTTDIAIHGGRIVGLGRFPRGVMEIDLAGKYVVPGLIDAHVHVESSSLCPEEFVAVLLAHGVTTAIMDPHEIANVAGVKGIRYVLDSLAPLPFNGFIALPSCVPATKLETSGARMEADDLREFLDNPKVIALGEMMNYPGVLAGEPDILAKLALPLKVRDGHAPGLGPQQLNAYALAGISTDHECSTVAEVRERLRRGLYVMLREGSAAKNLRELLPAVNAENSRQILLVTDDRHPAELLQEGSIDHLVRLALRAGLPPVRVIQMASLNAAQAYGLAGIGAVAPGYWADFCVVGDLEQFNIETVYWHGQMVSSYGSRPSFPKLSAKGLTGSVKLRNWHKHKLVVSHSNPIDRASVRVIGVQGHSLITRSLLRELPVAGGVVLPDREQKIAKLAVVERHGLTGQVGLGFVEGLGLIKGAIASTVAHDSHNLIVVGMTDDDMDLAVQTCAAMGGGICLVEDGKVIGDLPLSIAGLMTDERAEQVQAALVELHAKAHTLGVTWDVDAFMTLAFLSLPVIPELKLTDMGLVDVARGCLIELIKQV